MRIKNIETLTSAGNIDGRKIVADLLDAGLDALDPYLRVKQLVEGRADGIYLHADGFTMRGDPQSGDAFYPFTDYDRIIVIGAAKGVQRAALALEEVLGDHLTAGHVIAKHGEEIVCKRIGVTLAGHPVPDAACVEGCQKIEALVKNATERDLIFTVFGSGCGSLFTYPAEGITIDEIASFTHMMQIEKGVPTSDLNQIRTHIDRFKGGRIARMMRRATVVNLVTADPAKLSTPVLRVSYFEMLAKNTFFPTIATASTYADCVRILHKWDAWERTPESIKNHLLAGNDATENMGTCEYESLGNRFFGLIFKDATVYPAVRKKAAELGLPCVMLNEYMEAEAREAGFVDGNLALCASRMGEPFKAPIVLMSSGENVVTVGGECGIGGRNQEYCLATALKIAGSEKIVIGAVDTDGTDGPGGLAIDGAPSCLSGAVVDGFTASDAKAVGIDLWDALKTHGTSEPLWKLNSAVIAETGVSALDLRIIYIGE